MRTRSLLAIGLPAALLVSNSFAQSVISARSGLVNYFEGVVFLDGQPLARKAGTFARMKDGSTLTTEYGRAEVLLTPDTYLRMGEKSTIRMVSGSISDTRVEVIAGSSIVDSSKAPDGAFVSILFKDSTIRITKPGHYRVDAEPPQLRVYQGIAEVNGVGLTNDGKPIRIQASQLLPLDGSSVVKRFTQGSDGLLDLWSEERGDLIASNLVNSQSISDPLLDSGPGVPADLASYIGYVPLASVAPLGPGSYSLAYGGPFSPYGGLSSAGIFQPYPAAAFLYAPRRYTPIFTSRPVAGTIGGRTAGFGYTVTPPSIFTPRPTIGARPGSTVAVPMRGPGGVGAVHGAGGIRGGGHR
jgi:hypothetical protein